MLHYRLRHGSLPPRLRVIVTDDQSWSGNDETLQVKLELDKVAECERFLLLAERENIEKFNKQKERETKQSEEVI